MRAAKWIVAMALAACVCFAPVACGGDEGSGGDGDAATTTTAQTEPESEGNSDGQPESADDGRDGDQSARSEQIDEFLSLHPIFSAKRFLNFAARGNAGACSLLSD